MGQFNYDIDPPAPPAPPVPDPESESDDDNDDNDDDDDDDDGFDIDDPGWNEEILEHEYMNIIITHTCYCFSDNIGFLPPRPSDLFIIEAPEITRGMVRDFLEQNYESPCNHTLLELIERVPDIEKTWSPWYSS